MYRLLGRIRPAQRTLSALAGHLLQPLRQRLDEGPDFVADAAVGGGVEQAQLLVAFDGQCADTETDQAHRLDQRFGLEQFERHAPQREIVADRHGE